MNFLYAILTGIVPPVIWLLFWLREDQNPEPKSLIGNLFIGGAVAVFFALSAEKLVSYLEYSQTTQYILWAAVEEIFKFIVLLTVAIKSASNNEPIDAMMYCVTIALGFAAVENTFFVIGPFSNNLIATGIITGNMRAIGATLVHTVCSASVGFMYGYLYYKSKLTKFFGLILGLAGGIALHAMFNLSIIGGDSTDTLKAFAWVWCAVVLLLVLFEEVKTVHPKEI